MLLCLVVLALCMLAKGAARRPSLDDVVRPLRIAKHQLKLSRQQAPTKEEDAFDYFDRDADGRLTKEDLDEIALLRSNGKTRWSAEELDAWLGRGDTDGDGALDEREFVALVQRLRREREDAARVFPDDEDE